MKPGDWLPACPPSVLGPASCELARPPWLTSYPSQDGIVWTGQRAAVATARWGTALLPRGPGGAPRAGVH